MIPIFLIGCMSGHVYAQSGIDSMKKKMEKFDLTRLNQLKKKHKTEDTLADGSIVKYIENADIIQESVIEPNGLFQTHKQYFRENLMLKREERKFYDMPIGKVIDYNRTGKIISEIDYDALFPYSLTNLTKDVLQNYQVDLLKDKNFGIQRHIEDKTNPYYELHLYNGNVIHVVLISGTTGKIISETYTTLKK